jgi:hypothetical protein
VKGAGAPGMIFEFQEGFAIRFADKERNVIAGAFGLHSNAIVLLTLSCNG